MIFEIEIAQKDKKYKYYGLKIAKIEVFELQNPSKWKSCTFKV